MKLNALERSADRKLTILIREELDALPGSPGKKLVIDTFLATIRKKSKHLQKILNPPYFEARLRAKLRGITRDGWAEDDDQLRLFPDLKFIPKMLVFINSEGKAELVDVFAAKLSQFDQWMTQQVETNLRGVERKHAHYRNFRAQFTEFEKVWGDSRAIGELIELAVEQRVAAAQ